MRPGNVAVRVREEGKRRWTPGHGLWVNDVFAPASAEERKHLRRIGDEPVIKIAAP